VRTSLSRDGELFCRPRAAWLHRHTANGGDGLPSGRSSAGSPQDESVQCADLWPVRVGIVFTQEDGPQGGGYSSACCGILFKSLWLWAGKMPPVPTAKATDLANSNS